MTPLFRRRPRRLGLVLSGGGARGLAHVGVLRALTERGIRPVRIAGTSAGALVGALYGSGHSAGEMIEFFREKSPFRASKITLTKRGFIDMEKVFPDFEETFPDDFGALDPPLSVVAADLLRGDRAVFDSGPLIPAILASSAVPLVFTPMEIDGRLLVDGGVVDNFPVAELRGRCDVDLGSFVNPLLELEESDLASSLAIVQRALEIGSYTSARRGFTACDFVLSPETLRTYGTFDMKSLEAIEAIGYEAARARIGEIARKLRVD